MGFSTFYTLGRLLALYIERLKLRYTPFLVFRKPLVINFNATEVCNSSCTMCNIWKNKQGVELTSLELQSALSDKLFSKVQHIGITGGEPTLRKDLPQMCESIISALPSLKGVSMITNCIDYETVILQITALKNICKYFKKDFSVMVSLDGVGDVHDQVRGIKGNFEATTKVIAWLKEQSISFAFGATISKINASQVDNLLFYVKQNDLYGRFRVAEFIKRLNNQDRLDVIRNFNEDERYNLWLFFFKLQLDFETSKSFKRTYKSIQSVLMGGSRLIGCPYHDGGIVFNARGELAYCAPKSKIIGNAAVKSASNIFLSNRGERNRILREDCNSCIHDYHAPLSYTEYISEIKALYSKRFAKDTRWKYLNLVLPLLKKPKHIGRYTIFIVGWYGTETVGDKAILGSIINHYNAIYNDCKIVIGSLYPTVTQRTCQELSCDAQVVDTQSVDLIMYAGMADITIMGGGPLMDLDELYVPLRAFQAAKRNGKKTIVYGCGLGPLNRKSDIVKEIFLLADEISLRDMASVALAQEWLPGSVIDCSGDPAIQYVQKQAVGIQPAPKNQLACFLREWSVEYKAADESIAQFLEKRSRLEDGIAIYIRSLADELQVESICFYHMHNFVLGGDDRDFSRRFIATYFPNDGRVSFDNGLSTVNSIILNMKASRFNLCMRFHSVVFAEVLQTEYAAIDYTRGGKILHFLEDINKINKLVECESLIALNAK